MPSIRSTILTLLPFLVLFLPSSNALPVSKQAPLAPGRVTCEPISTYTTAWFLAHTRPAYRHELHNTALFYTRGTSCPARDLAEQRPDQYTTIWEVWPCYLYNDAPVESNPLRCIHGDHELRRTFYENMSRAFARMARTRATVMHSKVDYAVVPEDGIWARIELPTIRESTDVETLLKLSEDSSISRSYAVTRDTWETVRELIQRAMNEVRAIFREARSRSEDGAGSACSLWGSVDEGWLEMLW
ncbi:hypothetical protein B0A55_02863 [Friedmanniomyces simplex]|uniref:Uncharacterized protein n=1 Tax=Friedmanniomyces simplex TaxID=329884 RepID=A0A4U0XZZ2_9PEZI|nr:hypothetical protein B0A55_02863 [Friedmanniomyces simplex]